MEMVAVEVEGTDFSNLCDEADSQRMGCCFKALFGGNHSQQLHCRLQSVSGVVDGCGEGLDLVHFLWWLELYSVQECS